MIIVCPKCETSYNVSDEIINDQGREMRCVRCGEVWLQKPEEKPRNTKELEENIVNIKEAAVSQEAAVSKDEVLIKEAVVSQEDEMLIKDAVNLVLQETKSLLNIDQEETQQEDTRIEQEEALDEDVYARLSMKTEEVSTSYEKIPFLKRIWIGFKEMTGLNSSANRLMVFFTLIVFMFLVLFYYRYDVTSKYPFMEKIYDKLGIESVILGNGLKFDNVSRIEEDGENGKKIIVRGFVVNKTDRTIKVPTVLVKFLNKDGDSIVEESFVLYVDKVSSFGRASFSLSLDKPEGQVKYIVVTFTN